MHLPKPNDGDFQLAPAGTHKAVCYRVIHLGTQEIVWEGKKKQQEKIMLSWELPDEKMEDGRPFTISKRYTWSTAETANLRIDLESWRGKPFTEEELAGGDGSFNIRKVLGVGCLLTIVHKTNGNKTYANISSVSGLMKGMSAPQAVNQTAYLWIDPELWSQVTFNSLSDGIKATIEKSPEFQKLLKASGNGKPPVDDSMNDEIPF